ADRPGVLEVRLDGSELLGGGAFVMVRDPKAMDEPAPEADRGNTARGAGPRRIDLRPRTRGPMVRDAERRPSGRSGGGDAGLGDLFDGGGSGGRAASPPSPVIRNDAATELAPVSAAHHEDASPSGAGMPHVTLRLAPDRVLADGKDAFNLQVFLD